MSALETLYENYMQNLRPTSAENTSNDNLIKFVEIYITEYELQREFEDLLGTLTCIQSEEAFRAGFIAGAFPLQRVS